MTARKAETVGVACGVGAYALWGAFPAFFGILGPAGSVEILAHRVVWTLALMLVVLWASGRIRSLRGLGVRTWLLVAAASALIAINWGTYIYGVTSDRVVETALGYFINPLVSVLLGVVIFRERLVPAQIVALALAAAAVVVITVDYGHPPYIALTLALSFALYGLCKKVMPLDPRTSLTAEGIVAGPIALGYLVYLSVIGTGTFLGHGPGHSLLLIAAGPVTALPLLLFGAAAQRVPLRTLGMLQYLTPALQMMWGVAVLHEDMPASRWIGFALIWVALAIFTTDALVRVRRGRRSARSSQEPVQ
ncbi:MULTISPECIES: EamA family transporter RarD [Rhodococcus]|uniref:EamA family transporter RarD n=1 Tax=Rhodococcus oxybenzonivorans TaxID=1990687 RepID=A0AAE4UUV6_9NOCA|nr:MULTISPECIES: EamA family transporter RarD [Rhodococcus]MDV7244148.1 EamA family transporter RarD [Rhodococcus oxybenzonivorans]MDV7263071.1 EamA family transporter RarD [Rhodococcus oxybenzonivorans]MDV7274610.1 EamA family transporter RarD [Rhodococcus oxybenzonivorans]MDV7335923.1 EamA family transporter RarD [Rhodococcus oxybenzonivorans]MDV7345560.1 EamA family transporter RarD [Rhodococcus oxybenzonivorans]